MIAKTWPLCTDKKFAQRFKARIPSNVLLAYLYIMLTCR